MSFPRYSTYKDSGVELLGEIPEHWEVKRLKRACQVLPSNVDKKMHEGEAPVRLCNYTDVYYNERITADIDFMEATASSDQVEKFTLRAGDTIVTKDSETADDIAVAAYVPRSIPGVVCGYHLAVVRPRAFVIGAFVTRLFGSHYAKACFEVLANGLTRVGLGKYELDNIEIPIPPSSEQVLIAAFLDRETAKIDELVAEQQRLMELLKEKRHAVISHAVTKGLNPDAPMKPSGVEWIGEVPAHWEVAPLKRKLLFLTSGSRGWAQNYADDGSLFIRIANLTRDSIRLDLSDVQRVAVSDGVEGSRTKVQSGDVLFSITAYLGSVAVVPGALENAYVSQHVALARLLQSSADPKWIGYVALSVVGKTWFETQSYGGTKIQLSLDDIRTMPIPFPPIFEQRALIDEIERQVAQVESLASEAVLAVALLQERRAALISAAVTGQIDVRVHTVGV